MFVAGGPTTNDYRSILLVDETSERLTHPCSFASKPRHSDSIAREYRQLLHSLSYCPHQP